jgi:hypothetical protein
MSARTVVCCSVILLAGVASSSAQVGVDDNPAGGGAVTRPDSSPALGQQLPPLPPPAANPAPPDSGQAGKDAQAKKDSGEQDKLANLGKTVTEQLKNLTSSPATNKSNWCWAGSSRPTSTTTTPAPWRRASRPS